MWSNDPSVVIGISRGDMSVCVIVIVVLLLVNVAVTEEDLISKTAGLCPQREEFKATSISRSLSSL